MSADDDTARCHQVMSAGDWPWVLSAPDRWRNVEAPLDEVSLIGWWAGPDGPGWLWKDRGFMSTGDFPCLGTGFGGVDPWSGRGVDWILTARC